MTSGQEMEQVYSYNPGARTGHTGTHAQLLMVNDQSVTLFPITEWINRWILVVENWSL